LPEEEKRKIIEDIKYKINMEFINNDVNELKNFYADYKNNTCGYSGCREHKKFIDYVRDKKMY